MVYLSPWERHWTIFYKTLSERGYALPQRYNVAGGSTSCLDSRIDLDPATTEHLYRYMEGRRHTTAAIRRSDNRRVMIKVLSSPFREYLALHEHEIHTWLLSDGREKDPANHTIPILETLRFTVDYDASATPKITEDKPVYHALETECLFHVLPWLEHPDSPGAFIRYQSVVFVKQMLEGLAFMHRNLVVHGDIDFRNTMLGVVRNGQVQTDFLVKPKTFFEEEIRFYYIDFDFSRRFEDENEAQKPVFCTGGKYFHLVPELCVPGKLATKILHDPFKLDVWILRMAALDISYGALTRRWDPALVLRQKMKCKNPKERPSAQLAVELFDEIVAENLTTWQSLQPCYWNPISSYRWKSQRPSRGPFRRRWEASRSVLRQGTNILLSQSLFLLKAKQLRVTSSSAPGEDGEG